MIAPPKLMRQAAPCVQRDNAGNLTTVPSLVDISVSSFPSPPQPLTPHTSSRPRTSSSFTAQLP